MSVPEPSEARHLSPDEIVDMMDEAYDPDRDYTLDEEKQWYEVFHIRHQKLDIEKPDIFAEGAFVGIEYVTGEEDLIPFTNLSGTIVSASEDTIVVDAERLPERYRLDLEELHLDVECVLPRHTYDKSDLNSPGRIHKIQLSSPPWDSEYDDIAAGLVMEMMYSEYEWVCEGIYLYPPAEFFA